MCGEIISRSRWNLELGSSDHHDHLTTTATWVKFFPENNHGCDGRKWSFLQQFYSIIKI